MLAVARRLPVNQVDWRDGSAGALPFEDESFDVVCCAFGLMFFPDQQAALREMRRVLKGGGRLMVMVWGSIFKCPGQLAMQQSWTRHFEADYSSLFAIQHLLGGEPAVRSLVQDAGFRLVSVRAEMGEANFAAAEDLPRVMERWRVFRPMSQLALQPSTMSRPRSPPMSARKALSIRSRQSSPAPENR